MGTSHSSYYFGRRKEQERKDLDAFLFSSVFIFPFWQVVKFEAWIDQSINHHHHHHHHYQRQRQRQERYVVRLGRGSLSDVGLLECICESEYGIAW